MTYSDIKTLYGDDVTLLFKGREPFVEIKKGIPAGVMIENPDGNVMCYICKKFFDNLSPHLRTHDITNRNYKKEYGLNLDSALCSKRFSQNLSEKALKEWSINRDEKMKQIRSIGLMKIGRPKGCKKTYQEKNRMDTCEEQIKRRMELLLNKFGPTVSKRQADSTDAGLAAFAYRHHGGWNEFKKQFGLKADYSSQKKNQADLIYELRNFVKLNSALPWNRESQRLLDFPFSKEPYIREFGSLIKAYAMCGVYRSSRSKKLNGPCTFRIKI